MIDLIEVAQVIIAGTLISVLMGFVASKHQEGKIGDVAFFHLLTFILISVPWFLLFILFLFDRTTMTESFFIVVVFLSILCYIQRLGTSFFNTEVFGSTSQYVVFFTYTVLAILSAFYVTVTLAGAVIVSLANTLIPVVGFYHFNRSNISKKGLIFTILLGLLLSPLAGWVALGLFYYRGKNRANRV